MFKALLIILISGSTFTSTHGATSAEIKAAFEEHRVIPDAIPFAPEELLGVEWASKDGLVANLGHLLPQLLVEIGGIPRITWWNSKRDKFYFFIMTDLDIPIYAPNPPPFILTGRRPHPHWIVRNIPGGDSFDISRGNLFQNYAFPGPPEERIHRYTFLVFEQPSELHFEENDVRAAFNITILEWSRKYKMGRIPVAGNFVRIEGIEYIFPENRPPLNYTPTFFPTEPTRRGMGRNGLSSINLPAASLLSLTYISLAICCIFRCSLRF